MSLYSTLSFIAGILLRLVYKIEVTGKEKVLEKNRFLLCSNHIHILDPIILSIIIPRQIAWMGKKELFENKALAYLLNKLGVFPVDRKETELSTIRHAIKLLKSEGVLGIFPEGRRVTEINLENAKPGVALISIKSKSPIIPVYIEGSYRPFSKIKVHIGDSFDFSERYDEKLTTNDYKIYGQEILSRIYSMKSQQEEL